MAGVFVMYYFLCVCFWILGSVLLPIVGDIVNRKSIYIYLYIYTFSFVSYMYNSWLSYLLTYLPTYLQNLLHKAGSHFYFIFLDIKLFL
ncbi:hypothetical protein QBC42DRAFT_275188 [Cladorrhinum samala]|uniref:Uncharacterized protein n=1 Tax=Cladorrhinum samala TaxID=585594 RepID=A0AAV9HGI9_9PEZI|nr:hypothetical protein QBC42DRAFT_275188 [Cladorrhinum samala]